MNTVELKNVRVGVIGLSGASLQMCGGMQSKGELYDLADSANYMLLDSENYQLQVRR